MIEVGRVCVKIAGREALNKCVVVKVIDEKFVMIDGQVKRRKCNVAHLEPLNDKLDIKEDASTEEIKKAFEKVKVAVKETKSKEKKEKPIKKRTAKKEAPKEEKPKKEKKASKK